MTYQDIGHILFWAYLGLCVFAMLSNLNNSRALIIVLAFAALDMYAFDVWFDGMAPIYKWKWYLLVSLSQFFIGWIAQITSIRASTIIVRCSALAILLNLVYLIAYLTMPLPRQGFFVGMNVLKAIELGSLLVLSAPGMFLWRLMERKRQKETPWTHQRAATSGTL